MDSTFIGQISLDSEIMSTYTGINASLDNTVDQVTNYPKINVDLEFKFGGNPFNLEIDYLGDQSLSRGCMR